MKNQVHISAEIDAALHAQMVAASARYHTDEQSLLRRALEEFLARDERYRRELAEDEERYQHYLRTGEHSTQEEMEAWMDAEIAKLSAELEKHKG